MGKINLMKILKFIFAIPAMTLIIIFQVYLQNWYLLASNLRDGEAIIRNICAGYHLRGGWVVLEGF